MVFALDKLWLKPFIVKPYWLGHDLSLCSANHHSCFFGPRKSDIHREGQVVSSLCSFCVLSPFWSIICSLALSVFWEVIASRTTLDRNPMEKENVIDDRTLGRGDLADRLHQLTKICTTTTSTSQVSWQHPLLENPIRHCIISRTASALYLNIC